MHPPRGIFAGWNTVAGGSRSATQWAARALDRGRYWSGQLFSLTPPSGLARVRLSLFLAAVLLLPAGAAVPPTKIIPRAVISPQIALDPGIRPIIRLGPICSGGGASAEPNTYRDRYSPKVLWYFPSFALKVPLVDSFTLQCARSGVEQYVGRASFIVTKTKPANLLANEQSLKSRGLDLREIPLNGLTMALEVKLSNDKTVRYAGGLRQNGNDYECLVQLKDEASLMSFYQYVSDPANRNFCTLSIKGSNFGYVFRPRPRTIDERAFSDTHAFLLTNRLPLAAPGALFLTNRVARPAPRLVAPTAVESYELREALPFERQIHAVNYDCRVFPNNYLVVSGGTAEMTAFGCRPPFGTAPAGRKSYAPFVLKTGVIEGCGVTQIYQNTFNRENFLVIPQNYLIAFDKSDDEEILRPSAYLFTSVDANGINNSTAAFQFNIAPDVSAYQLLRIKKLILKNLPANLHTSLSDLFIDFPERVRNATNIVFDALHVPAVLVSAMGAYENGVIGSKYLRVQFQNVQIGDNSASWVSEQLKVPGGGIIGNVTFDVDADSDPTPQATIWLALSRVSGNGIVLQTNGGVGRCLVNKTLYKVSVDAYQTVLGSETLLPAPLQLPANGFVSTAAAGLFGDLPQVAFRCAFKPDSNYTDSVLKEVRINADTIRDQIIVTSNTGLFSLFKIDSIAFVLSIIKPGETDPEKALTRVSMRLSVDGAINQLPFVLPVNQYLSKWSAIYSTAVNFLDGTQQVNPPRIIDDLNAVGKSINLTASKLNLRSP